MNSSDIDKQLNDLLDEIKQQIDTEKLGNDLNYVINSAMDTAKDAASDVAQRASDSAVEFSRQVADSAIKFSRQITDEASHYFKRMDKEYMEKSVVADSEILEEKTHYTGGQQPRNSNRVVTSHSNGAFRPIGATAEWMKQRDKALQRPQKQAENKIYYQLPASGTWFKAAGAVMTVWNAKIVLIPLLNSYFLYENIPNLLFGGLGIALFVYGCAKTNLRKRVKKYVKQFQKHAYCDINDLAQSVNRPVSYVLKDVNRLIKRRTFPQGHISDDNTCLMLNDKLYEQYRQIQAQQKQLQLEEQQRKDAEEAERLRKENLDEKTKKLYQSLEQGEHYLQQIHTIQANLSGEEISAKISRLELITEKIFELVKQSPEHLPDIRRMLDYYLPTTVKLLQTYEQFEAQPIKRNNIASTQEEILNTLDTINEAFEQLFDRLFDDTAMDISSDISVLHTMFASEGLTNQKDFDLNEQK
ncbi:MAG: 5-bromo-4-chloroindolyl phosphate hydrolysis family protein [Lachnospiraceae bacterium]